MVTKKYSNAVGRRKESSVVVKLSADGSGDFVVNAPGGKQVTLKEYFGGNHYLFDNAVSPLLVLGNDTVKRFDMEITLKWGGIAGQSDAIKLALSRALIVRNPDHRLTLKPYGLLKRDPRIKERKKPGLKKARKRPKRSKR
jgi:small subunit ribosomal protein S9